MRLLRTSTDNHQANQPDCFALGPLRFSQRIPNTSSSPLSPRRAFGAYLLGAKQWSHTRGYTLIEMLVVMGILTMLGGLGLFVNMDTYHGYMFRAERDALVSALQKARSQSMNNFCLGSGCTDGKSHGVYVEKGKYVIFQGSGYASRDTSIDEAIYAENDAIDLSGPTYEVVFAQLSGDVTFAQEIGMHDGAGHFSTTSINSEGRISWTN